MNNDLIRKYGVIFKYLKKDGQATQVHFTVDVGYKGELRDGSHLFFIDRKKVFINQKAPDLIIEQLAEKAGSCLYPMDILTSPEGPFQEIVNYEEIKKRWDDKKIELEQYYVGEIAEKIIANLDIAYSSKHKMERAMQDDLFLLLFFMPIYRRHVDRKAAYDIELAFVPFNMPIKYHISQEVEQFLTTSQKQLIHINGYSDMTVLAEPDFQLHYKIDNETKSIFSIVGEVSLVKEKDKTQKIEIELYQLDDQ